MSGAALIINLGIVALFAVAFVFFYIKDGESQRRLSRYEKSLDDLNKEIYRIQKHLQTSNSANDEKIQQNLKADFRSSVDDIYAIIEKDRQYVDNKIAILEDKIKELNYFPSSSSNVDDRRVIAMYKDGWSVEAIARELRITKSEVDFILKVANV